MSFKTELHAHNAEVSPCSSSYSETLVSEYVKAGYSTVVLANHFYDYIYQRHKGGALTGLTWDEKADFFIEGYKSLEKAAVGRLNVIMAAELHFPGSNNDYLCYGITEEFIRNTPDLFTLGEARFHDIAKANGWAFVHAHPFRNEMTVKPYSLFDGIEVFNGHIKHDSRNYLAASVAEHNPHLIRTSGTDYHDPGQPITAGIETENEIKDIEGLLSVLKSGKYTLIKSDLEKLKK